MQRSTLYIAILLLIGSFISFGQQGRAFKTGEKLAKYYSLDSVKSVEMENWKGKHFLSEMQIRSLTKNLKTYSCAGSYAHTKPGHFWCEIIFKDGSYLFFYSNTESDIITQGGPGEDDHTFSTKSKVNFENY